MPTLTPAQIYTLASNVGLSSTAAATATLIALAESGGRTDAEGDIGLQNATWGPSVGLWQIRSLKAEYGKGNSVRDASRLKDPEFNAFAMSVISNKGQNFKPWTTFTSGAYKKQASKLTAGSLVAGALGSALPDGLGVAPGQAAGAATDGATKALTGWAGDAMKLALYVVGGGAAVGLAILGAVHTVSSK
jgi:hypothetical protein